MSDILETIEHALLTAAAIVKRHFRTAVPVSLKDDQTPVTLADRAAEAAIRAIIRQRFPEHAIFGEEEGLSAGRDGTWVIDPIDGTKSFMSGNPLHGVLLGFVRDQMVVAGGLAAPALDELWLADRQGPTRLNNTVCCASTVATLANACLLTTSPDTFSPDEHARFELLSRSVAYRRFGGDCYIYAMIAGGFADLAVESGLYPYDYLPLVPLVEQAGGIMTDWDGHPLSLSSGCRVIAAASPALHAAALEVLQGLDGS